MRTTQFHLAYRPSGMPAVSCFKAEHLDLPDPDYGEVKLQAMYFSVDPYMRGRMSDRKSYVPCFEIGKPIVGAAIARVISSNAEQYRKGDIVSAMLPWSEYANIDASNLKKIDAESVKPSFYLGIMGMPGLTAYFGLLDIGKPKEGETLVISGAAGAVGLIVGQIGKIMGCNVVGITGSEEKADQLKEKFGFDHAINYRETDDLQKSIAKVCPEGVDIYFHNVGGPISDAVMANINFRARIVLCGQISLYNDETIATGPRIQPLLVTKSALMQGFIISNFEQRFPQAEDQIQQWVKDGMLMYTETIIPGFRQLPAALIGLFKGENTGKMIVEV